MTSQDRIIVSDLLLRGIIGTNDWERENRQDIIINLTLFVDVRRAGETDRIEDTLNYRTVTKAIIAYVENSRHYTVEALASAIARIAIVDYGVERIIVRVEKPGALRFARSVGVEIDRAQSDFA